MLLARRQVWVARRRIDGHVERQRVGERVLAPAVEAHEVQGGVVGPVRHAFAARLRPPDARAPPRSPRRRRDRRAVVVATSGAAARPWPESRGAAATGIPRRRRGRRPSQKAYAAAADSPRRRRGRTAALAKGIRAATRTNGDSTSWCKSTSVQTPCAWSISIMLLTDAKYVALTHEALAGNVPGHMTPSRTTFSPQLARSAASRSFSEFLGSHAPRDGRYSPPFSTALTPWKKRARPSSSTIICVVGSTLIAPDAAARAKTHQEAAMSSASGNWRDAATLGLPLRAARGTPRMRRARL